MKKKTRNINIEELAIVNILIFTIGLCMSSLMGLVFCGLYTFFSLVEFDK